MLSQVPYSPHESRPPSEVRIMSTSPSSRPLSPHLSIYRFHFSMALSILHRASGVALIGALMAFILWLWAAAYKLGTVLYTHRTAPVQSRYGITGCGYGAFFLQMRDGASPSLVEYRTWFSAKKHRCFRHCCNRVHCDLNRSYLGVCLPRTLLRGASLWNPLAFAIHSPACVASAALKTACITGG